MTLRRLHFGRWWARALAAMVAFAVIASGALALHATQADARRGVSDRFTARAGLAASFVSTYVHQLTSREQAVAAATLAGPHPTAAFNADVQAFGFPAAVVLDSSGRAIAIAPAAPTLVGQQLASRYAHLAAALAGHPAVSGVVESAATHQPVVAFAVPFSTPSGLRVFSGAYAVSETPLVAFLKDTTTLKGAQIYLTDDAGTVLASNAGQPTSARALGDLNRALSQAATERHRNTYRSANITFIFTHAPVAGTPWTLLIAAPTNRVFVAVDGSSHWLPWLILGVLSILVALAGWLSLRVLAGRRQLAHLNEELIDLTRTDALTGLANRRYLSEQLASQLANSRRYGFPLSVLMIDVDHFKRVNDTHGHQAGDATLRHVARQLRSSLRDGDLLARWGGEEFLAVLPYTDADDGTAVAFRLCAELAAAPMGIAGRLDPITVRASIGVAQAGDDSVDEMIHRADLGLYEAKSAGRNTVRAGTLSGPTR